MVISIPLGFHFHFHFPTSKKRCIGLKLKATKTTTTTASNSSSSSKLNLKLKLKLKSESESSLTVKVLEWDKLCDSVASFAGTSLGRQTTKAALLCLDQSYQDSLRLLAETKAAVQMHNHLTMDFTSIDIDLVKSAIQHAHRGFPLSGFQALALVSILQLADSMQINLKAAIKDDSHCLQRFMPLADIIMDISVSRPLLNFILKLVDQDGSVKDSASPSLKRSREQVRLLERKLYRLMEILISNEMKETSSVEVSNTDGRWCIKSGNDLKGNFDGLLLSSGVCRLVLLQLIFEL